jgi:hypothetical protein
MRTTEESTVEVNRSYVSRLLSVCDPRRTEGYYIFAVDGTNCKVLIGNSSYVATTEIRGNVSIDNAAHNATLTLNGVSITGGGSNYWDASGSVLSPISTFTRTDLPETQILGALAVRTISPSSSATLTISPEARKVTIGSSTESTTTEIRGNVSIDNAAHNATLTLNGVRVTGGGISSITAGTGITIDDTIPTAPVISSLWTNEPDYLGILEPTQPYLVQVSRFMAKEAVFVLDSTPSENNYIFAVDSFNTNKVRIGNNTQQAPLEVNGNVSIFNPSNTATLTLNGVNVTPIVSLGKISDFSYSTLSPLIPAGYSAIAFSGDTTKGVNYVLYNDGDTGTLNSMAIDSYGTSYAARWSTGDPTWNAGAKNLVNLGNLQAFPVTYDNLMSRIPDDGIGFAYCYGAPTGGLGQSANYQFARAGTVIIC